MRLACSQVVHRSSPEGKPFIHLSAYPEATGPVQSLETATMDTTAVRSVVTPARAARHRARGIRSYVGPPVSHTYATATVAATPGIIFAASLVQWSTQQA